MTGSSTSIPTRTRGLGDGDDTQHRRCVDASDAQIVSGDSASPADELREPIDIEAVFDGSKLFGLPLVVTFFTVTALIFDGFDMQAVALVAPVLLPEWGIERAELGGVLAAALIGMAAGAFTLGPAGDRYGRRRALLVSMTIVAVGSLLCAQASSPTELTALRFITGVGLGGSIPNATTLMTEFAPAALRNLLVSITVLGVAVGGVLGAELAAHLVPALGWRSIFIAGAALPAALVVTMAIWLPESPRFLARHPARRAALAALLNRATRGSRYRQEHRFVLRETDDGKQGIAALFANDYRRDTLVLWLMFFTNMFAVHAFFSWLPTVLAGAGFPLTTALRGALVFNLGGVVGAVVGAVLMTRLGSRVALLTLGALGTGAAVILGLLLSAVQSEPAAVESTGALLVLMGIAGAGILGLQVGMFAVAARAYPTASRASGVGAAAGVARFGGILSAFAGGILLSLGQGGLTHFFGGVTAALILAIAGTLALRRHVSADAALIAPQAHDA